MADVADDSFNVILELGFAESIRREWAWRRSRGESTANLAAFRHLDSRPARTAGPADASAGVRYADTAGAQPVNSRFASASDP